MTELHDPPSPPARQAMTGARRPFSFAATLALGMAVSTFLMVVFGTLAPFVAADLALSRTQLGTLTTALFLTGALLSPVAGPLVDRFGGRRLLVWLFLVGALSFAGVAVAPSYGALLGAALFGGLAVALGNPVTNALVAAHTRRERQGVVTGIKQSGVQAGVFLGGAVLPPLAEVAGWRSAALAGVILPVLGLAVAAFAVPASSARSPTHAAAPVRARLPRGLGWLTVYALLMGIGVSAITAYLPLYGVERLAFAPAAAGLLNAVVGAVGVGARILWGRVSDRSALPVQHALTALAGASVLAAALVLVAEPVSSVLAWAGAAVAGASAAAWNAVGMLAIVRHAPLALAGRASGMVLLGFYFGFVVGPALFGALVDASGSYGPAWGLVLGTFAAAAVVSKGWGGRQAPTRGAGQ